jgi:DNA repair protein SbcD/Mre11
MWGAAHDSPSFFKPLLGGFRLPDRQPSLLLLHGTDRALAVGKDKGAFCPFSVDEVRAAGFGLALLGHIHHRRFSPEVNPLLCYPGSPEPLGFDEESGHAIIMAKWDGQRWSAEFQDISQWRYAVGEIDASGLQSREEVVERIRRFGTQARDGKQLVARVTLCGQPGPSLDLDLEAIAAGTQSEFADLQIHDQTSSPFDLDVLKTEQTTTGAFVRRMLTGIEEAKQTYDALTQDKLTRALNFGLLALEGREVPNV